MTDVLLPRLSDTMETGLISAWLVSDGDNVGVGDPLAEIETDKATVVIEAEFAGRIRLLASEGGEVNVGTAMAQILSDSEYADPTTPIEPAASSPALATIVPSPPSESDRQIGEAVAPTYSERLKATPVARRVAADAGVELSPIAGSGPGGRVLKTDVVRSFMPAIDRPVRAAAPLTRMQKTIARRMTAAKQTIPHFYLTTDVDMTDADALRRQLGEAHISVTDLVVRAAAVALARMPDVNASWSEDGIVLNEHVNVGLAVALDDGGLVVPVLRGAEEMALLDVSRNVRDLVVRARSGSLVPGEMAGGTFTVSNLGMLGIRQFHAIINPPESGILAVGAVVKTPVVRAATMVVVRDVMTLSLSADHRVYSGATGATFLREVRELLESPLELFLPTVARSQEAMR